MTCSQTTNTRSPLKKMKSQVDRVYFKRWIPFSFVTLNHMSLVASLSCFSLLHTPFIFPSPSNSNNPARPPCYLFFPSVILWFLLSSFTSSQGALWPPAPPSPDTMPAIHITSRDTDAYHLKGYIRQINPNNTEDEGENRDRWIDFGYRQAGYEHRL